MKEAGGTEPIEEAGPLLRRRLAALSPRARLDALLEAADARRLVRSVPAEELYVTLMEVGLADATEIVQLASSEQFRTFVDLGGWKKDTVDPRAVLRWLRAARGEDPAESLRKLHALDLELFELVLRAFTVVHDLEEDPDVNPEGVTLETPEGRYLVELKLEGAELAGLRAILQDVIAANPFEAVRLLEAVRWEIPSELEETAFQFRKARLADLGFPELEDAVRLFTFVEPGPGGAERAGDALSLPAERVDYLDAAVRKLDANERENVELELKALANAVLVTEAADPGDVEDLRRMAEMTRDYLSLGLEHLTGGAPERSAETVRDVPLRRIFQIGFSLTLRLKFRADRLWKEPLARWKELPLMFAEEAAALSALRSKRPRRALRVEGAEPVPFRSLKELAASERLIERAEAQVAIFRALLGGTPSRASEILARFGVDLPILGVERVFAAAVATALVEGRVDPAPVPSARATGLCEQLFEGTADAPRLRPAAAERAFAVLEPSVEAKARPELRRLIDVTLVRVLSDIGRPYLREGKVDPTLSYVLPIEDGGTP